MADVEAPFIASGIALFSPFPSANHLLGCTPLALTPEIRLQPCLVKLPHLTIGIIFLLLHRSLLRCTFLVLLSLCCLISRSAAAALYYKLNIRFCVVHTRFASLVLASLDKTPPIRETFPVHDWQQPRLDSPKSWQIRIRILTRQPSCKGKPAVLDPTSIA